MATLENIRKRGKLLAVIIGLALAAFILGDIFNSGKALFNNQKFDVVTVNGEGVNINDYEHLVTETETYYQVLQGTSSLPSETSQQIRASVWDMTLREALLTDTYNELGINVPDEEMKDMFIGNNIHPMIAQTLVNPQTGQFDKVFIQQLYQNFEQIYEQDPQQAEQLRVILKYTEDYIRKDRTYNKYLSLVSKGLYVTSLEAEEDNFERKYTVNIELVGKTVADGDTSVTASEEEIKKYYEDRKELFKSNVATRDISYITFDVFPSATDSLNAKQKAEGFKEELKSSNDEQSVVNLKSANPQLVKFYTEEELMDSVLFNAEPGFTYGPYLDLGMYNVAKVVAKENRPDSVSARHILISPENPQIGSMVRAQEVADSIVIVLNNGGDFEQLVNKYTDDKASIEKGGLYEDFVEGSMVTPFSDFCFENSVGTLGTVETQYGVHIIEVTGHKNIVPKTKVAFIQVAINSSQETYDLVYSEAMKIRNEAEDKEGFEKVIADYGFVRREAPDLTQGTYSIPGLDDAKEVINWSFKAEQGEVSKVFELGDKYVLAMVASKNEIGYLSLEKVRTQVENSVIQEKKVNKIFTDEFEGQTVSDLDAFASKIGKTKLTIPNVSFNAFQLANIGYEPALLGALKKLEENKVFGPIKGTNGAYFVKAVSITDAVALTAEELAKQKATMKQALQQRASYQAYVAVRDAAKIVDRRADFY